MGVPMCSIEIYGRTESFEITAGTDAFGDSASKDLIECRTEKRLGVEAPAGVFELQLTRTLDASGRTWHDKISPQDLVVIQMMNYTGQSGEHGAGELHTVMIGLVDTIQTLTVMSSRGEPHRVIRVRGADFGKIFRTGVVTYWSFLGAALLSNVGSMQNFIDASQLIARPDVIASRLMSSLFERFMDIRFVVKQHSHSIFELLAKQLESYGGEIPAGLDLQFLNGEGSFWSFFVKIASPPFHELFVDTRRSTDTLVQPIKGATTIKASRLKLGKDGSNPVLVMRPTPFPYMKPVGSVVTTPWDRLRKHTINTGDVEAQAYDQVVSRSDEEVFNMYLTYAQYPWIPDQPWLLSVPAIIDLARFKRYGFRPLMPKTSILQAKDMDSKKDPMGIFYTALNWRLASWNVMNDTFQSGYKTCRLLPHVHIGDRLIDQSDWQDSPMEYYIETVVHHYVYNERATTTMGLTRGLRSSVYKTISQVLKQQGLKTVPSDAVMDQFKKMVGKK